MVASTTLLLALLLGLTCEGDAVASPGLRRPLPEKFASTDYLRAMSDTSGAFLRDPSEDQASGVEEQASDVEGSNDLIPVWSGKKKLLLVESAQTWHKDIFDDPLARQSISGTFYSVPQSEWIILTITVIVLIALDFFVLRHFNAEGSRSGHIMILGFWVAVGMAYNCGIWYRQGGDNGILWCCGYCLEWLLSMDNLFVFHLIFQTYATPKALLHKALFFGIVGSILSRILFFQAITALLGMVKWVRIIMGLLLIYSGVQAVREEEEEENVQSSVVVSCLKWCLGSRLTDTYDSEGHGIFIWEPKLRATLLLPVIVLLEFTDIIFAMDSVSAKVAQIPNFYISYSSSVLAVFGLRAMFFILKDLVDSLFLMKYGLCFILIFIGVELILSDFLELPAQVVCVIILSVIVVCAAGSLVAPKFSNRTESNVDADAQSLLVKPK